MAAKKSRGLGRGLDALFGDMEVDILKNDNEDTPKVEESSTDANKPSAGSAAKRTAGSSENAAKAAESDGSVQNVDPAAGGILYIDINDIKPIQTSRVKYLMKKNWKTWPLPSRNTV